MTVEEDKAVKNVKTVLSPTLAIHDTKLPSKLHTDASAKDLSDMLPQWLNKNKRVIADFSKQTTSGQRVYDAYEIETLAVGMLLNFNNRN